MWSMDGSVLLQSFQFYTWEKKLLTSANVHYLGQMTLQWLQAFTGSDRQWCKRDIWVDTGHFHPFSCMQRATVTAEFERETEVKDV